MLLPDIFSILEKYESLSLIPFCLSSELDFNEKNKDFFKRLDFDLLDRFTPSVRLDFTLRLDLD